MGPHEKFMELCAAATAGELSTDERRELNAHLAECADCRRALRDYERVTANGIPALASEFAPNDESPDGSWSVEDAEKKLFETLDREHEAVPAVEVSAGRQTKTGQRFTYRPSQIRWKEIWMPFAAAVLLVVALSVTLYRTGLRRGVESARVSLPTSKASDTSLEAQASDAAFERSQLMSKLAEDAKNIEDLKRQLSEQSKSVRTLQTVNSASSQSTASHQESERGTPDFGKARDAELAGAQAKLADLQKALDAATAERAEASSHAAVLQAKVNELTELMNDREQALDQKQTEVAKQQELLEHDRDIRELMGARELYMADVHDVTKAGTNKTYGRVFYTKGKSLIFYAFDLDAHPGVQNASSFQAWGRRGPDRQQALSLGIFYQDNVSKKRWVLKADDPKTLQDIDAVFVTVEPNGGSHHPSGKQLLFAYLRVSPNHP
jgi:Skp family chaperone for outer membrane proteins